uniref:Uncharacterized protein n=1 Tax=Drosophila melanogaster TaxID=7227 RepID=A0A0B4KFK5_DROME|nr:uncharacterized protein Dmel_CG44088 [Drosophila melanogaster]AGB95649.1 uncharacterized protein Dmel_CG44088 [Drosophila melanogaster]|eukprot:NP_001262266.1 uncharacterized protein Dmel_CG44088 [Drosophila melanogaster]
MSSFLLVIFILLALRTSESSETGNPLANEPDPLYMKLVDPMVAGESPKRMIKDQKDVGLKSTSSSEELRKLPKTRGRQKRFIRNPNYVKANEFYDKMLSSEYVSKRYKDLPPPHPGFGADQPPA